ncbi:hypothetical protein ACIPZF_18320 [Pseudomonas sp. NPDC089752]|uniref:hypothetical protein n=1 Tax=Pseudomonas sp. NPDC089752 TaxID=3364472 RepID=UPI003815F6EA
MPISRDGGRLNEQLKGSLSTLWGDYDGNVENVANGHDVNGNKRKGVRGMLEYEPSEALRLTLIACRWRQPQ